MIKVQGLTKMFGDRAAVNGVTFTVQKGEVLGFLGPNGAGKTTTMRMITGFLSGTSGSAEVNGFDVFAEPLKAKAQIGYLPETPPLYPEMTVLDNLKFAAGLKGLPRKEREDRARETAGKTGAAALLGRLAGHLSKGQRQRVGLAQALVSDPPVLILDEPTAGLDPLQIIETRKLIRSLAGNRTVILSTHILPEASATCDRVVIINKGRIVAEDTQESLARRVSGAGRVYVKVRGDAAKAEAALKKAAGSGLVLAGDFEGGAPTYEVELPGGEGPDVLAEALVKAKLGVLELRPASASLEEVFLKLTMDEPAPAESAPAQEEAGA